jgi:glycosyltransferase involved in cell wall biosynthesis
MLRLFTDHIANPVFGMAEQPGNKTLGSALPAKVKVVAIPDGTRVFDTWLDRRLTDELQTVIDGCYAVYLRLPFWTCWDVFVYARSKRKKIITSYHGDWTETYRKRQANLPKRCILLAFSVYIDHIIKKIVSNSETVFFVGQKLADMYGSFAKKKVVFANFLHSLDDIAQPHEVCTKPPYKILYVGNLEERKGVKYLIEALAILRTKGISINLTLVGSGSLKGQLKSQVDFEGLSSQVKFLNYIQYGKKLMNIYRSSDVLVLPSISSEGVPKVAMEAMTQGIPVVATDIGSTRYLLGNGRYGIVMPPADSQSIAAAVQRIIENLEFRTRLINEGLELARLSTREKQKEIIEKGLREAIPEIVGFPAYLRDTEEV